MAKQTFFGWVFGAAKDAQSAEGLEAKALQELEAKMAENETLQAKITELQSKLATANTEVETAMATVVAERTKLADERATFDAYVKEKTAWLDEPAAVPAKVKEGFQPDANGEGNAPLVEKEPWADAVNERLEQF